MSILDSSGNNLPPEIGLEGHWLTKYGKPITNTGLIPSRVGKTDRFPVSGSCIALDKTDDYVNVGNLNTSASTICVWVKPNSVTAVVNYLIQFTTRQSINFINAVVAPSGITNTIIYVNGNSGSTLTTNWNHLVVTTPNPINLTDVTIGRFEGNKYYGGQLFDLILYSDVKTLSFINELYNSYL
jgi:hypothetical protein